VTASPVTEKGDALSRVRRENETLYAVIGMVSSSLSLDRVLGGIVDIATDATDCHACFIYFVEEETLVLRAASPRYAHLVGRLSWGLDEGLTGWVARTKTPAFIRENAMGDPRMKYVPEIEEERFQSMVAVPILGKGERVIGVIVLHTKAPREFEDDVLNFLVHTAWLVSGAIQNAQLYEETRRRVDELTTLTQLSQTLAAVTERGELYAAVTRGARQLLTADSCQIWRLAPENDELALAVADPPDAASTVARPGRAALLLDLMRREKNAHDGLLVAPLVAGDEQLGIICCVTGGGRTFTDGEVELLQAVADQTAVGLKKAELIERLTAEHVVKDMFDALESGTLATAEAKAGEAHWDFSRPHALLRIERAPECADGPPWPELASRAQAHLRRRYPLALFDGKRESVRAIVPLHNGDAGAIERLHATCDELGRDCGLTIGISEVDRGVAGAPRRMREAVDAATVGRSLAVGGGAVAYGQIGVYRYLVHMELDQAPQDRYGRAVAELMKYDRRRHAQLVETLECYLDSRSSVAASARALFIHPNTVRQRLERIERITELDLRAADLLSLELALKLARLHGA
jgi:GAF domain-containing protein